MLTKFLRRIATAFGFAALAGAAVSSQPAQARPAMWEVRDADTRILLFGTIHLLPKDYRWRTPEFDRAVAASQSLVVETIVDEKNPAALAGELQRLGFRNDLPPLAQRVAPEKRAALAAAVAKSKVPAQAFDRMETWAAAFMLLGNQFSDIGLHGSAGVESTLRATFTQAGKPIGQLETNGEQLGFFDSLPEHAQRQLLEGAIEKPGDVRTMFNQMVSAWSRGDVKAIAKTFNEDLSGSPELVDSVLRRRNENWTRWIRNRMATPGSVMIAVGAGHLAGPQSVVAMLQKQGYRVRRVQ